MAELLRVLVVDHETRLSGGERNLVDLVAALPLGEVRVYAAVPGEGALADALRAAGAEVHVLPFDAATLRVSRYEVARHPLVGLRHGARLLRTTAALWTLLGSVQPDVVHTTSQKAHLVTGPAARLRRVPHVWHMQDILERSWLLRAVRLVATLTAARVMCLSDAVAAPLRTGLLAKRVTVVYPGVTQDPADPAQTESCRSSLVKEPSDRVVGIVGQLAWWKGQDVFVEAAARVADHRPDVRFVIAGACLFPQNEAAYVQRVEQRVADLALADRLVWLGQVEPVAPLMAALDVLVHASRRPEPFGRVIVEALAQGTPVVTTAIGAGRELVPGGGGDVVPPDDPAALADALLDLLGRVDDADQRAAIDAATRSRAARFAPEVGAAETLALWRQVCW